MIGSCFRVLLLVCPAMLLFLVYPAMFLLAGAMVPLFAFCGSDLVFSGV